MRGTWNRWRVLVGRAATLCVALAVAGATLSLAACSDAADEVDDPALQQQAEEQEASEEAVMEGTPDAPELEDEVQAAEEEAPAGVEDIAGEEIGSSVSELVGSDLAATEGGTSFDTWAEECLDQNGDVTAYAVSELKGWQLETLLQQQGYSWSTRNQLWVNADDSVAVVVFGSHGDELSDDKIAELAQGSAEASAGYRIVTSRYPNPQKAFDALVGKVMVCEDSEFTETSGVAVAYGPSMRRSLVFLSTSNDVVYLSIYGEEAIAAGLFDREAGRKLGSSIGETFQALTGRIPGAEH